MTAKPSARTAGKPAPKWRGCLLAAGVAALCLVLLAGIVAGVLFWKFRALRDEFADTQVQSVPIAETNAEAARRLTRTFEQMQRAVQEGRSERFVFTDQQLNQMVATVPAVQEGRGKVHFAIAGEHLKIQAGLPLEQVPGFQGRYLNGEFTVDLRMENGALRLYVLDAAVRGKPLPPVIMERLRGIDLAAQVQQDPEVRRQLAGIKTLRIENGKLLLETGR